MDFLHILSQSNEKKGLPRCGNPFFIQPSHSADRLCPPVQPLRHDEHDQEHDGKVGRQDRKGDRFAQQAKERTHERRAHIGAGHLDADDSL